MKRDYDDDGVLKPGAKATYRPNLTIDDLSKALVVDSPFDDEHPNPTHYEDGIARLKTYIRELRDEANRKCPQAVR